jgi:hypothetical protein
MTGRVAVGASDIVNVNPDGVAVFNNFNGASQIAARQLVRGSSAGASVEGSVGVCGS